jgi:hypothetical protein
MLTNARSGKSGLPVRHTIQESFKKILVGAGLAECKQLDRCIYGKTRPYEIDRFF